MKAISEFTLDETGCFSHRLYGSFSAAPVGEYVVLSERSHFLSYCDVPKQFKIVRMEHRTFCEQFKEKTIERLFALLLTGEARIVR